MSTKALAIMASSVLAFACSSEPPPANRAPVASAGSDRITCVGETVQLSAAGSTDADGDELTYTWTLKSAPAGSAATLTGTTSVDASIAIDLAGRYEVELVAKDAKSASAPVTVVVETGNTGPIARAGDDRTVSVGSRVTLDGSASTDCTGASVTFDWRFATTPRGSLASLANPSGATPAFIADAQGTYVVQLVVSASGTDSPPDQLTIQAIVGNPAADAGAVD